MIHERGHQPAAVPVGIPGHHDGPGRLRWGEGAVGSGRIGIAVAGHRWNQAHAMIEGHQFLDRGDLARLLDRNRVKLGLLAEAHHRCGQAVSLPEQDEGQVLEIGQPYPGFGLEWMPGRRHERQFLVEQPLVVEVAGLERLGQDRHVNLPIPQPHQEAVGGLLVDHDPRLRMARLKTAKQWRQEVGSDRGNRRHPHPARGAVIHHPLPEVVRQEQNLAGRAEHRRAGFREHQPAGLPLEQGLAEFLLEPGDRPTDRRLRQAAGHRRAGHAAQFRHAEKVLELVQFHGNAFRPAAFVMHETNA
jgi:hypothetical protein